MENLPVVKQYPGMDKLLTSHHILTPFNTHSTTANIVPLANYLKDKGGKVSEEEMKSIEHDIRDALSYLRSKADSEWSVTKDKIAVQVVRLI